MGESGENGGEVRAGQEASRVYPYTVDPNVSWANMPGANGRKIHGRLRIVNGEEINSAAPSRWRGSPAEWRRIHSLTKRAHRGWDVVRQPRYLSVFIVTLSARRAGQAALRIQQDLTSDWTRASPIPPEVLGSTVRS